MSVRAEKGFGIRAAKSGGFFGMNGLGDWSLAEDEYAASVFPTVEEAFQIAREVLSGDDVEFVPIDRTTRVTLSEPVEVE